jgi:phage/plasmid-associated DNA primase
LAEPFRLTTGRWYNKYDPETERTAKAPLLKAGFSYDSFAYGSDTPEQFQPDDGVPVQVSLICARQTQLLVIDVDHPEQFAVSATGQVVSWANAMSTRGSHFHIGVDMRGAADEDWPVQGRTSWGDVKSSGFVAAPGSVHYTGEPYQPTAASVPDKLVPWTPELLSALAADKDALVQAKRAAWGMTGAKLDDGSHLYASGYAGGSWAFIPDGGLRHDDELKDLLFDMHVRYGREEAECRSEWERLAGALEGPWRDRDFTRHWRKLPALRLGELEKDEATRLWEDFGITPLSPGLQVLHEQQQRDWETRAKAAADAGRPAPTPVPPDGPFENPLDRAGSDDRFEYRLGAGQHYARFFDARRPTDSDNARAVLARLTGVAVYDIDRGTWLKRVSGRWDDTELGANLRPVLVALEEVLPEGCADPVKMMDKDPEADASEIAALKAQAKNRERFSSTSSRQSIATAVSDTAIRYAGRVSARGGELDADPEVLWAGGVPWNLRASAEVPVRAALSRDTPHVMSAAVVPDPSVPTPRWDAFCEALWPGAPEDGREWALNVAAACFTGYSDAVMPILMGDPGRGKTHFVTRLIDVLGGNAPWSYGGVMNADLLRSDARLHGTFTLDLKGKRLAFVDEAPGHGMAAQRRLKSLTGGGALQGNRMRENPVSFSPTHTLVMTANHEDPPPLDEPALQRRARMIFFEGDLAAVDAASAAIDGSEEARAAWRAEMPGVLAGMMRRAAAWLADRHVADADRAPDRWQFKVADEVQTQDPVLAWLDAGEVVPDPDGTRSSVLRANFVSWCKGQGVNPGTETKWGRRLNELGFPVSGRDARGRYRPLREVMPGASAWMGQPSNPATVQPTLQTEFPLVSSSSVYGLYGLYSKNNTTQKTDTQTPPKPPTYTDRNKGETQQRDNPTQPPSDARFDLGKQGSVQGPTALHDGARPSTDPLAGDSSTLYRQPDGCVIEPVVPDKTSGPKTVEKGKTRENTDSPPKPKNPRTRLTDEEKLERAEARRAKLAADRLQARAAKVAELGGPVVPLPAIVLRDQSVIPVDPATAARFLAGTLDEVSVDVEHSGYPRPHKDYRLRLVQLGNEYAAVVFDPSDEAQAAVIRDVLANAKILHAHSALADLIPLEAAGLCDASVWDRILDTVNLAKLTDPALCDSDEAALKPLAKNLLGPGYALSWKCDELRKELFAAGGWISDLEADTEPGRSGWLNVPLCEAFVRYAASDVMDCSAVARVLSQEAR